MNTEIISTYRDLMQISIFISKTMIFLITLCFCFCGAVCAENLPETPIQNTHTIIHDETQSSPAPSMAAEANVFTPLMTKKEKLSPNTQMILDEKIEKKKLQQKIVSNKNGALMKLKDLGRFQMIHPNIVTGYGLIVGLPGTGDDLNNCPFTQQSLKIFMERSGLTLSEKTYAMNGNVASVIVRGEINPLCEPGVMFDVFVSSVGDAKSLIGGELILTELRGVDNKVYGTAHGVLSFGGTYKVNNGTENSVQTLQNPVRGIILKGGMIEEGIKNIQPNHTMVWILNRPDWTTINNIGEAIKKELPMITVKVENHSSIILELPKTMSKAEIVSLMSKIEQIEVHVDYKAKIIINENLNSIVIVGDIILPPFSFSFQNIHIQIKNKARRQRRDGVLINNVYNSSIRTKGAHHDERNIIDHELYIDNEQEYNEDAKFDDTSNLREVINFLKTNGYSTQDLTKFLHIVSEIVGCDIKVQ